MEKKSMNAVPIAVVGMECFFPKSSGLKEYWRLVFRGEDAITEVPSTHWSAEDYFSPDPKTPDHVYCKRGGFLDPVRFDPTEFGIPPAILEATDSSQLLGLLAAKAALENAGYDGSEKENTSVILGVTGTQELVIPLGARLGHPVWRKALRDAGVDEKTIEDAVSRIGASYVSWQENSFPGLLGNVVAGRIANRLDLGGTNCVIDAACASSLGAVHLAIMELSTGRSNMVVTGGVDTLNDIFMHMCFSKTSVLSLTGDARPFSKDADGTVLGEGIGILVLKRLEDAEKDQDRIYAVIKGIGTSSDGKSQSIYSPSAEGQIKALAQAYTTAGIDPGTVELIEAHGTGTRVGDEVEFSALNRFFTAAGKTDETALHHCALGSVKSMIGHTKAAAGAAGLIKTVLALYNKVLPPTLKAKEPDPALDLENSPFYLSDTSRPWFSKTTHPRRAGVSAFGFGGSNFHVVLEEYDPNKPEIAWDASVEILAFSNASLDELKTSVLTIAQKITGSKTFTDISTMATGLRGYFKPGDAFRLLVVLEREAWAKQGISAITTILDDAVDQITRNPDQPAFENKNTFFGGPEKPGKLAFVFPGQGAQYPGMGSDLLGMFPRALQVVETANALFDEKVRLSDFIYPVPTSDRKAKKQQEADLTNTDVAQPAIGSISLAMKKVLDHFGCKPDAACGHSFGEIVALHAAGWIDDQALLNLSVHRGRLMAAAGKSDGDPGTMLAVKAPLHDLDALISGSDTGVILANRNSPTQGVLSGPTEAIQKADALCKEKGYKTVALTVAAAFHSHLMKDAQKPFMEIVKNTVVTPTAIPVYANSTGAPYPTDPEQAKTILGEQLLKHVDFVNDIKNLYAFGIRTFVEVGPKTVLTGLIKAILEETRHNVISMDASGGKKSNTLDLALALCRLAALGYEVDLKNWESGQTPPSGSKKPKMEIMISGTNYRGASIPRPGNTTEKKPRCTVKDNIANNPIPDPERTIGEQACLVPANKIPQTQPAPTGNRAPRGSAESALAGIRPDMMVHALHVVQEGLKSMQALQKQTAETHQKFLESQTQANLTLQKMMENTQRLFFGQESVPVFHAPAPSPFEVETEAFRPTEPPPVHTFTEISAPAIARVEEMQTTPEKVVQPDSANRVKAVLLETVSELTGYPEDMLGLDMDIESDLGIDSIKRVEILSTMEEKHPGLPPVEPEIMGSLKTLNQILAYLTRDKTGEQNENTARPTDLASPDMTMHVKSVLLETVSELTGYPEDMLGLDMDIESDLGIDSIKRVEILSTMEEKHPGLPPVEPEIMGSLKTLNQILAYLTRDHSLQPEQPPVPCPGEMTETSPALESDEISAATGDNRHMQRHIPALVGAPLEKKQVPSDVFMNQKIYVLDDGSPIAKAIANELTTRKINSVLLPMDRGPGGDAPADAAGLVIPAGPTDGAATVESQSAFLENALMTAGRFAPALVASGKNGHAFFSGITFLDGGFGFTGQGVADPVMGGLSGLVKTAALEWDQVTCRSIDVSPAWNNLFQTAKSIVDTLLEANPDGPVEIGLLPHHRQTLAMQPLPCPSGKLTLAPHDVVVISGGARGVTAACARALAKELPLNFVLLGRSPEPFAEPGWLSGITDEKEMKKAILVYTYKGEKVSPKTLEQKYKVFRANREIQHHLAQITSLGSRVVYHSVDIRDPEKLTDIFTMVRSAMGPVSAIIHGAGVLEDRRIVDKTPEQFRNVFQTKVHGLLNLLAGARNDPLKYLVLFSSVAGRLGNKGQADYAMANEALNKIAQSQSLMTHKACRVLSINWGPWDGGMVTPALKKEFEKNAVSLIPIDCGAQQLVREMKADGNRPVEIVLGSMLEASDRPMHDIKASTRHAQSTRMPTTDQKLSMAFYRDVDTNEFPVLKSHILGGTPVVPFALMAEWFSHGALHGNPGLVLQGIDDMRVLKGIQIHNKKRKIRILTGKVRKNRDMFEVDVEIRNGVPDEQEVVHSRARALLTDTLASPPAFIPPGFMGRNGYTRSIAEIYEKILFHGCDLQGIKEVITLTDEGMAATLLPAPDPLKWMKSPLRSNWVGDPLVLDCAFQMASLWCFEKLGHVSLPVYSAAYRQYRSRFPREPITAVLAVTNATDHKLKGDFTFLDRENAVIAQITGFEAVVDESLNRAFKP